MLQVTSDPVFACVRCVTLAPASHASNPESASLIAGSGLGYLQLQPSRPHTRAGTETETHELAYVTATRVD
jgi:hypothetical protein